MRLLCTTGVTFNCIPKALLWAVHLRGMAIIHGKNSTLQKQKNGFYPEMGII